MANNRWNAGNNWGYPVGSSPQKVELDPEPPLIKAPKPGIKFLRTLILAAICAVSGRVALEFWPALHQQLIESFTAKNSAGTTLYGSLPVQKETLWNCGGSYRSTPEGGESCSPVETKLALAK
ncbi:MAG: hypothetical protein K1X83_15470 [Oligoflexia bacterium]|nr:hypothetical protein [Oligoflexia bacterium]